MYPLWRHLVSCDVITWRVHPTVTLQKHFSFLPCFSFVPMATESSQFLWKSMRTDDVIGCNVITKSFNLEITSVQTNVSFLVFSWLPLLTRVFYPILCTPRIVVENSSNYLFVFLFFRLLLLNVYCLPHLLDIPKIHKSCGKWNWPKSGQATRISFFINLNLEIPFWSIPTLN